jgi:uncharacterized protein YuzE
MGGTYDKKADAAYLYLVDEIRAGEATRQIVVDGEGLKAMVILDLDDHGRFLGIEMTWSMPAMSQVTEPSGSRNDGH